MNYNDFLKKRLKKKEFDKLRALENAAVIGFVGEFVHLCNPRDVFIRTDSPKDAGYIREKAIELGEEGRLATEGHTFHFDGYFDQARDKKNTKYLLEGDSKFGHFINGLDRDEGLPEVRGYLKDIMRDKDMFVCFFCLGPVDSDFSILAVQITDSSYVAHSEDILYRPGYELLKSKREEKFFRFIHSAGQLEGGVSKDTGKRRIYIDLGANTVYSVNTQYAGNTVGLKKLALRLAIHKASQEDWLAEHMFVMGIHNKEGKKEYFCGAYPSMCGKTSTAMVRGESIVGDDIAYLRIRDQRVYAANVERGIFGIIKDVNSKDDAILFKALTRPGEVIFSNILVDDKGSPFWLGKGSQMPHKGVNFSGEWFPGKTDTFGQEVPLSHKNARYTVRLRDLENVDEHLENPGGVPVSGLIYGGRDSDTSIPVEQAFSWQHGIITKAASLESETTAATLGQEGIRVFNPMSNIDFLSVLVGKYIEMNLAFGERAAKRPLIFSVNYFLKGKHNKFLNDIEDKRVWLKWMSLRVSRSVSALETPTGFIPLYGDLQLLFKEVLRKDYTRSNYIEQFTLRIPENLGKIERIRNIYRDLVEIPGVVFEELKAQEDRLLDYRDRFGDYVSPELFKEAG